MLADETFLSTAELLGKFKAHPFMVTNTYKLMDSCNIEMDFHVDKNKKLMEAMKKNTGY